MTKSRAIHSLEEIDRILKEVASHKDVPQSLKSRARSEGQNIDSIVRLLKKFDRDSRGEP